MTEAPICLRRAHTLRPNPKRTAMSIVGWLILGLIAGFIASKIVNKTGEGVILDIVLGVVGAVVGGFAFSFFGAAPVTGFNLYSMFVAVIGAILVLLIYHQSLDDGPSSNVSQRPRRPVPGPLSHTKERIDDDQREDPGRRFL